MFNKFDEQIINIDYSLNKKNIIKLFISPTPTHFIIQSIYPHMKVFDIRKVQRDFAYKISAADFFNDILYFGDEKGNIYKYPIKTDDTQILSKALKDDPRPTGTKAKIDKIVAYPETGSILVLSDEKLFSFEANLSKPEAVREKVHDFAINASFGAPCTYGLAVITRKKEGFIYNHNPGSRKFEETNARFGVPELPSTLAYTRTHVILGFKKEYQILNAANSFSVHKVGLEIKGNAFCKVINRDQILFFQQNVGVFMSTEGLPKERNPCVLSSPKPILDIGLSNNYCFVLSENTIEIFNTFDSKKFVPVQSVDIMGCRGLTNGRVFAYLREDAVYLYEVPYDTQIRNLLSNCKVDQALQVLIQNVGENHQMISQLKLDAIWPLLKNLQFEKAKDIMKDIDFDIRQLVSLFSQLMSVSREGIRPQKTMNALIFDYLQEKKQLTKQNMEKESNEQKLKARYLLKDILQYRRERILQQTSNQQQHLKEKVNFPTSKLSIAGKLPAATLEQILETIDYALIKWYFQSGDYKSLEDFLKNNAKIYCKSLFEEFEQEFKSNKLKDHPTLMPRLFAAFGRTEEALEQWQKVSESKDDARVTIACEEAVKLLSRIDSKDKMMKSLKWVLNKKPEIGMSLFKMLPEGFVPSDQVIKHFEADDTEINKTCLQKYLQIVVIDQNTDEERLHTKLISKYLENLFKVKRKESKEDINTAEFNEKLNKMRDFLRSYNARYASEVVLDKIKGCEWLLEDQIYLYSREKKHDEALQKLIYKQMYKEAERYCQENQEKTLTKYFTKLIKLYEDYAQGSKNQTPMIKKDIMNFLKKYASNTELDPIQVMRLLPGDWMLNDDNGGGLYDFLESAITHTLHNKRAYNTAKYLSEMDFLNVEYDLAKTKLASVRLTLNKLCKSCERPILDKMFVVFPNGVVCHQTCIKKEKISICPVTGQDFNKTFHG